MGRDPHRHPVHFIERRDSDETPRCSGGGVDETKTKASGNSGLCSETTDPFTLLCQSDVAVSTSHKTTSTQGFKGRPASRRTMKETQRVKINRRTELRHFSDVSDHCSLASTDRGGGAVVLCSEGLVVTGHCFVSLLGFSASRLRRGIVIAGDRLTVNGCARGDHPIVCAGSQISFSLCLAQIMPAARLAHFLQYVIL